MTRAVLYKDAQGRFTGFSVKGHSGYAEEGSDIICAAISILTTTCVNALESLLGVRVHPRTDEASGLLRFTLPETEGKTAEGVQLLMGALGQGLKDLAESYPGYVTFEIEERRKRPC